MDNKYEKALEIRRHVLGADYVNAVMVKSDFIIPFQEFVTKFAWGEGWVDESLDLKVRSLVTVAIVTSLGQLEEVKLHVAGAIRNGASADELAAVIKHCAIYAGIARGVAAMNIADLELAKAKEAKDKY
jgi:4-carboxymuconolactone decarboxylase